MINKLIRLFIAISLQCICSCKAHTESNNDLSLKELSSRELRQLYHETQNFQYVQELLKRLELSDTVKLHGALHALNLLAPYFRDEIGPVAIVAAKDLLLHADETVRHSAGSMVLNYGEYALPLLDKLILLIESNQGSDAFFAAQTIGRIGPKANRAQNALVYTLFTETETKQHAIESLANIGLLTEANLEKLKSLLNKSEESPYFRIHLAKVLLTNQIDSNQVRDILLTNLVDPLDRRRWNALRAIEHLQSGDIQWAIPIIKELSINSPDSMSRSIANKIIQEQLKTKLDKEINNQ